MAYLKSAPYPVPGLGLHGLPVESLHSSMAAYPGGIHTIKISCLHFFVTLFRIIVYLSSIMNI